MLGLVQSANLKKVKIVKYYVRGILSSPYCLLNILILIIQAIIVVVIFLHLEANVKPLSHQLVRYVRRQIWAIIVAYMLGIHNSYKEVQKTQDDIVIVIEDIEAQEDSTPKV